MVETDKENVLNQLVPEQPQPAISKLWSIENFTPIDSGVRSSVYKQKRVSSQAIAGDNDQSEEPPCDIELEKLCKMDLIEHFSAGGMDLNNECIKMFLDNCESSGLNFIAAEVAKHMGGDIFEQLINTLHPSYVSAQVKMNSVNPIAAYIFTILNSMDPSKVNFSNINLGFPPDEVVHAASALMQRSIAQAWYSLIARNHEGSLQVPENLHVHNRWFEQPSPNIQCKKSADYGFGNAGCSVYYSRCQLLKQPNGSFEPSCSIQFEQFCHCHSYTNRLLRKLGFPPMYTCARRNLSNRAMKNIMLKDPHLKKLIDAKSIPQLAEYFQLNQEETLNLHNIRESFRAGEFPLMPISLEELLLLDNYHPLSLTKVELTVGFCVVNFQFYYFICLTLVVLVVISLFPINVYRRYTRRQRVRRHQN